MTVVILVGNNISRVIATQIFQKYNKLEFLRRTIAAQQLHGCRLLAADHVPRDVKLPPSHENDEKLSQAIAQIFCQSVATYISALPALWFPI